VAKIRILYLNTVPVRRRANSYDIRGCCDGDLNQVLQNPKQDWLSHCTATLPESCFVFHGIIDYHPLVLLVCKMFITYLLYEGPAEYSRAAPLKHGIYRRQTKLWFRTQW